MPLREYKCNCGFVFDELIYGDYPEEKKCPMCGNGAKLKFSVSAFKVSFKDGWDAGAGKNFSSQRQRDTYLDKHELIKNPDGAFGTEGADFRR